MIGLNSPNETLLDAVARCTADLCDRDAFAGHQARFFAHALLDRLEIALRGDDCEPLDRWLADLSSVAPLTDYAELVNTVWACILRRADAVPGETLVRALERRDRLMDIIEVHRQRPKRALGAARIAAVNSLHVVLETSATADARAANEVGYICLSIANRFPAGGDENDRLWAAALVHDIGMVLMPQPAARASSETTPQEAEAMQAHVAIGVQILSAVPVLADCVPIVAAHHERFDGSGYPAGLRGNDIPFEGRILAVADAVGAMLCERSERPARSGAEVQRVLTKDGGRQWDPLIARAASDLIGSGAIAATLRGLRLTG